MIHQDANSKSLFYTITILFVALLASPVGAQNIYKDNANVLAKYVDEEVIAIVYIDLESFDLDQAIGAAGELGFNKDDVLSDLVELSPAVNATIGKLKSAGLTSAFAMFRMSDLANTATSWVLPVKPGHDLQAAAKTLHEIELGPFGEMFANIEIADGVVLVTGNADQMATLKATSATPGRIPKVDSTLGAGSVGALLIGDRDSRRAIKELLPELPEPFSELTGKFVADKLEWGGFDLTLNKNLEAKIVFETNDSESSAKLMKIANQSLSFLASLPAVNSFLKPDGQRFVFDSISPVQDGNRISISTNRLTSDKKRLAQILTPALEVARQTNAAANRMHNLRMVALTIHNYESAHQHFPPQSTVDAEGKSLLSWRVQILPFMEQNELYEKFHHDEPWDSEHNLKLVKEMPFFYADVSKENNRAGKTNVQVPSGKGRLFDGAKESTFSEVSDGTVNTILVANVAPSHAVIWTKPDDWNVDLDKPLEKLKAPGRKVVEVVTCDGAAHRFSLRAPLGVWRQVIQHDDGETVHLPNLEQK